MDNRQRQGQIGSTPRVEVSNTAKLEALQETQQRLERKLQTKVDRCVVQGNCVPQEWI
jgi:hypothetical protein